MASLCISSITEGELLFGLAKRPATRQLQIVVQEFLKRVAVLPWDSAVGSACTFAAPGKRKSERRSSPSTSVSVSVFVSVSEFFQD